MKIIHTFSSQKYQKISTIDLALWHMSCLCYLAQGYDLKLYCEEKDIKFLENNKLLKYYKEIDTITFKTMHSKRYPLFTIDEHTFWFIRKLIAISNEFDVNPEPFVYSDTDLFIFNPIDIEDCDCLFWTMEERELPITEKDYYCDWKYFSLPPQYIMPDYVKETNNSNYNMGLVYFKDKELFYNYFGDVLSFILFNPCEFTNDTLIQLFKETHQDIAKVWAMNAEQRIMTGFVKGHNLKVKLFDENGIKQNGICENGAHYFLIRNLWNQVRYWEPTSISVNSIDTIFGLQKLFEFKKFFFRTLADNELFEDLEFFKNKKQFKELDKLQKHMIAAIKELNH